MFQMQGDSVGHVGRDADRDQGVSIQPEPTLPLGHAVTDRLGDTAQ
jgi:hypothetical protein